MRAYADTTVAVEKSQRGIRDLLKVHGARRFALAEGDGYAEIAFAWRALGVRIRVPIVPWSEDEISEYARARRKGVESVRAGAAGNEDRRVWRVLFWLLKTRIEAVESGVETFEQAFLAHLLDPATDLTVYEQMAAHGAIEQLQLPEKASAG